MADITPTMWPAIWSAVAATFSAATAVLALLVNRSNVREAIRPELVITKWGRKAEGDDVGIVGVLAIKNIGRGAAFNIYSTCKTDTEFPAARMPTFILPVLAVGDSHLVDGSIYIHWSNVPDMGGFKILPIDLIFNYSDARGAFYGTVYQLCVEDDAAETHLVGGITVAPGVTIHSRSTKAVNWISHIKRQLQLSKSVASMSLLGRPFREAEDKGGLR
jgi:hypothetical protein